jgi:hypothetical protein
MGSEAPPRRALGIAPRLILVFGGLLLGALIALALASTRRGDDETDCPSGDDAAAIAALRSVTGPDGLRRFEPDGCQLDARGFRNARIPERADVVAMGDSNTWGASGTRRETWPSVLARNSGLTVYNISMPGWGPIDFLAAVPEALERKPKFVAVALYLGNDVYDAYARVARPAEGLRHLTAAYVLPPDIAEDWIWQTVEAEATADGMINQGSWTKARYEALARAEPERLTLFEIGWTTVYLNPRYRLYGVNLDEPRVAFGLEVTKSVLARMAEATRAAGARLVVILLPSKEYVYCGILPHNDSPTWSKLCSHEARIESELLHHLDALGVAHASALTDLRSAAASGREIYPSCDTHPNSEAMALFADRVRRVLGADGSTQ